MRQSQQSRLLFSSAEMFKKPLWQTMWTQIRLLLYIGAVCSGSTLFASILNSSVMLGNYLQQTTSADNIFRCIFFLGFKGFFILDTGQQLLWNSEDQDEMSHKAFHQAALLAKVKN